MTFATEPPFTHGTPERTGILLCNLGTPDAPTTPAVRRFLKEFLSDHRVVEVPRLLWMLILHGLVLRVRPKQSAAKYASIWTPEGSPLTVWTDKQAKLLAGYLGERGHPVVVRWAMRYGSPSIASVLSELRFVNHYHDDPAYIAALAKRVSDHWMTSGRPDKLVLSFHGVPKRTLTLGDPYHCECLKTARLLTEQLRIKADQVVVTFQSRLGRAEWLQPYTEPTLIEMARAGVKRVDVMCPGFTSDNLETLEEIDQEAREAFLHNGGEAFHFIQCLNDQHEWMAALAALAIKHLQGWPTAPGPDAPALVLQRSRAKERGAVA